MRRLDRSTCCLQILNWECRIHLDRSPFKAIACQRNRIIYWLMIFHECRLSDEYKNLHCTGYSGLLPIRCDIRRKWTSNAVDRLLAVNPLTGNCRQSPMRQDEGAPDYLNIQQPPVKRPSYCRCRKAIPIDHGSFITEQPANTMISKRHDGQATPTTNSAEN